MVSFSDAAAQAPISCDAPMAEILTKTLACGMVVAVEPIANADTVALQWMLPAGSAFEPERGVGTTAMLAELLLRGAGDLNSRAFSEALDRLGAERSVSVRTHHMSISAVMRGEQLDAALELLELIVRKPMLPADALEPVRSLCIQAIDGLADDPAELVSIKARERHLPPPFNRSTLGDRDTIEQMQLEPLREFWSRHAVPRGAILGVAGKVDAHHLLAELEARLGDWSGAAAEPVTQHEPERGMLHIEQDTAQSHIALAFDAPPEGSVDSMLERIAINVLSGGTSSRLFTEVRQKRALCYSVSASYGASRDYGVVSGYAGTTPQRAQETLDVMVAEFRRLFSEKGATEDEFRRAVIGLKSHLVMQGESTSARASAIANDVFRIGRARPLAELAQKVESVTLGQLNDYLASRALGPITIASIGPEPLRQPAA